MLIDKEIVIIKSIRCGYPLARFLAGMFRLLKQARRRPVRRASPMELSDHLLRDIGYEPGRGRHSIQYRNRRECS